MTPDELAEEVGQYAPPDIPLRLTATGLGSRPEIVEYVRLAIATTHPAIRLPEAIVTSILSRLGASYAVAYGFATVALVPTTEALARCEPTARPIEASRSPAYTEFSTSAVRVVAPQPAELMCDTCSRIAGQWSTRAVARWWTHGGSYFNDLCRSCLAHRMRNAADDPQMMPHRLERL